MSLLTPHLALPLLEQLVAGESGHNSALAIVDALAQLSVIDRDLTAPPGGESEGDRYWVASGATGDWSGHDDEIAWYDGSDYQFAAPKQGWRVYVEDEDLMLYWNGSDLLEIGGGAAGSAGVVAASGTPLSISNSAAWENLLSYTIPGGTFAADEGYLFWTVVEVFNTASANTLGVRFTLDGNTLFSDTFAWAANANNACVIIEHRLFAQGGSSNKLSFGTSFWSDQATTVPSGAAGTFGTADASSPYRTLDSIASGSDVDFEIDLQWGSALATSIAVRQYYYVQQLF